MGVLGGSNQNEAKCSFGFNRPPQTGTQQFRFFQTGHPFEVGFGRRKDTKYVQFSSPFDMPPSIFLSLVLIDLSNKSNDRVSTKASEITCQGFLLTLETWENSQVYGVDVSWLAF